MKKDEPGLLKYIWCSILGHHWMFVNTGTFVCRKGCGAVKNNWSRW